MAPEALDRLPIAVRSTGRIEPNGEVAWPLAHAADAVTALADAGFMVLGLDMRTYYDDGGVMEIPFSDYSGISAEQARDEVLAALDAYSGEFGEWVLVTWR